jgi:hypothetical protein
MTAAAAPRQTALALELIRPFTESPDARLRGNAIVALSALVESTNPDLSQDARDELVRVLCAEPGGSGLDWQRRFMVISVDAIRQLGRAVSESVGRKVFESLDASREPMQQAAIARLILAACDGGRLPWSIGWRQFRRCTSLAGRPSFWLGVWAALWRLGIVWLAIYVGALMLDDVTGKTGQFSEGDLLDYSILLAIGSAVALGIVLSLSIPGNVRPPRKVYVLDTIVCALAGGFFVPLGTLLMLPDGHRLSEDWDILRLADIFLLGALVAAGVRALRWANDFIALEPEEYGNVVRPAAAIGLSTVACVAAAHLGMETEVAAATFPVLVAGAVVLASTDVWLEEKGPRSLRPVETIPEWRWLLPVFAGAMIGGVGVFLYSNLRSEPNAPALPAPVAAVEANGPAVTVSGQLGNYIELSVTGEGDFDIIADNHTLLVEDKGGSRVYTSGGQYWYLTPGTYRVCPSDRSDVCVGRIPESFVDHVVWSFGLFNWSRAAEVTITPQPPLPSTMQ